MANLYNKEAQKIGEIDLPDRLFARSWNSDLVHQALMVQTANRRANIAHAKTRSEVSGGGRKPWRQKGTGRARHGSIRSPIWAHGGVTHGPLKEKKLTLKINQKMLQGAIFSILSKRLNEGEVKIIDFLPEGPKTKSLAELLRGFLGKELNALLILGKGGDISRSSRNLTQIKALDPRSLNVYDLLRYKNILLEKNAVDTIDKHYHALK